MAVRHFPALAAFWSEPRYPAPPPPGSWDRVLVAFVAVLATAEALLRDDPVWRPTAVALGLALAATLYFRRSHPFGTFLLAFGVTILIEVVAMAREVAWDAPSSHVFMLLLPYALFRWGAGREAAVGIPILMIGYGLAAASGDMNSVDDAIGAAVVLLFPAALGAVVRLRARDQAREIDRTRSRERERLARELHDTVAHHVSAIAIQAQAGQAVAANDPERGLETLAVIEQAASRTLAEMRDIVRALREDEAAELAPQKGLADLEELKAGAGDQHPVELELSGDLDELRPAVGAALYRMAQEAITNAVRHARNKSGIWVQVHGEDEAVRLTVTDDGQGAAHGRDKAVGYGLVGLAERAALLGGTLEAGPGVGRGWRVEAVLPKIPGRGGET